MPQRQEKWDRLMADINHYVKDDRVHKILRDLVRMTIDIEQSVELIMPTLTAAKQPRKTGGKK